MEIIHNDVTLIELMNNSQNNIIQFESCASTQSKVKNNQCTNKRKAGSIFCGVHSNVPKERIYAPLLQIFETSLYNKYKESYHTSKTIDLINSDKDQNIIKNVPMVVEEEEQIIIHNDEELRNMIIENRISGLSVTTLRNYIKTHITFKNIINYKASKNNMIIELKAYFESTNKYNNSVDLRKIILVQSIYRRWSILRRAKCTNDSDILTMDSIYEIPIPYFYLFNDKVTKKYYGYDIRIFGSILYDPTNNPKFVAKCPYTSRPFTIAEIVSIEKYIEKLKVSGINLEIEKPKLSKEKEIEHKCVDIFSRMDLLDNYTNSDWFMKLDNKKLLDFYDTAKDIWSYRIQMPLENKKKIVQDGIAFTMPRSYLAKLPSKLALQNIVLREMDRFISEGINREEKKLGAMLMLTALVEVSNDAAQALPHLVQIF
jgi:hypothetical protein